MTKSHRWTIIRGCDNIPIVIGMNIPTQCSREFPTIKGFESFKNLKRIGFDMIVSCCSMGTDIQNISSICNVLQLEHVHVDCKMSMFTKDTIMEKIKYVVNAIHNDKRIVICCPNGVGNTAVFAGVLSTYMMHNNMLKQNMISSNDIVSLLRRMGPPNAVPTLSQYEHLMDLIGVSKLDIYPWHQIHHPHKSTDLVHRYLHQYKSYQSENIQFPILMNEYCFTFCTSKCTDKKIYIK
jgi:hypothetical protein